MQQVDWRDNFSGWFIFISSAFSTSETVIYANVIEKGLDVLDGLTFEDSDNLLDDINNSV